MNQVKPAPKQTVVTAPQTPKQKADAIEAKMKAYPQLHSYLMPELQRVRAEILIRG